MRLNIQVNGRRRAGLPSILTNFPTQAHGKQKNSDYSNRCAIKSPPYRLSIKEQRSIYRLHAGVAGEEGSAL